MGKANHRRRSICRCDQAAHRPTLPGCREWLLSRKVMELRPTYREHRGNLRVALPPSEPGGREMKKLRRILEWAAMGMLLSIGAAAHAQGNEGQFVVHPAAASQMITVMLKDTRHWHGKDEEFVIAQAAGFSPGDVATGVHGPDGSGEPCDVITTFDVVKTYEERQTWRNVRQRIDIVVNGQAYPAKFRELGFYPLGLNLACIDFESANERAASQVSALPLAHGVAGFSSLSYNDAEIANSDPGTPFLNA